jgi:hypothetical protein
MAFFGTDAPRRAFSDQGYLLSSAGNEGDAYETIEIMRDRLQRDSDEQPRRLRRIPTVSTVRFFRMSQRVIYVQTFNHVVYLSGLVDSVSDIDTAEAVARETPGVTDVVSSFGMNP